MSARVSISLKAARELARAEHYLPRGPGVSAVWNELNASIARAERTSEVKARLRKPKAAKKRAKREETSALRAVVMDRANGRCELCRTTPYYPLELHHAFGRVRAQQAESNCLAACRSCHRDVTDNKPSAAAVLEWQAMAFDRLGHHDTARNLRTRAAFVEARGGQ